MNIRGHFPHANTITHGNMDIPFWMFQLEEYVEVLFRGKPIVHEEVDALREFIPEAKIKFRDGEDRVKLRPDSGSAVMTADTAATLSHCRPARGDRGGNGIVGIPV